MSGQTPPEPSSLRDSGDQQYSDLNSDETPMSEAQITDLHSAIAPHLPFLRRFARALSGAQAAGDRYTAATLEAILADPMVFDRQLPARLALYKTFCAVWRAAGGDRDLTDAALHPASGAAVLAQLDPRARQAFLLAALEEFSIGEIATIMDIASQDAQILFDEGLGAMRNQAQARILVIEDEPIIALDIAGIVTGLGHESVGIADTADRAVAMALEHKPDLVLADIQLADGSSGIDAVRDILPQLPVPVIFITAYPERLLTGERPEPTFLITKPFKRTAVEAAISQALFFNSAAAIDDLPRV